MDSDSLPQIVDTYMDRTVGFRALVLERIKEVSNGDAASEAPSGRVPAEPRFLLRVYEVREVSSDATRPAR